MAEYEAPAEVRPLEKLLKDFAYNHGLSISQVFDDWLFFIMGNFNLNPKPEPWWQYSKEQNNQFHQMFVEWMNVMNRQIAIHGWFDVFGELYQSCVASSGRRSNTGQFFTPVPICDLMTAFNAPAVKPTGQRVLDPTCGSGRTLLSFHVEYPGNFMYAEDIDKTCCMMTVANFLIHGVVGEVVWHDTLHPESWNGGWKINEQLNSGLTYGLPHMRTMEREESAVMRYWQHRKEEIAAEKEIKKPQEKVILDFPGGNPVQLTLF